MPKIRSLKRDYFRSRTVRKMSRPARLTLAGVIACVADDHGRFLADARLIRTEVFPWDDDITDAEVETHLREAAAKDVQLIRFYRAKSARYAVFPKWANHQWIARPSPSSLPEPRGIRSSSQQRHVTRVPESVAVIQTSGQGDVCNVHARHARAPDRDGDLDGDLDGDGERNGEIPDGISRSPAEREDVLTVCQALEKAETEKGHSKPRITFAWKRDARLLLDRDKRPLPELLELVTWVTADPFWRLNIHSPGSLRKHYGRLLDEMRQGSRPRGPTRLSRTDEAILSSYAIQEAWKAKRKAEQPAPEELTA